MSSGNLKVRTIKPLTESYGGGAPEEYDPVPQPSAFRSRGGGSEPSSFPDLRHDEHLQRWITPIAIALGLFIGIFGAMLFLMV